MVRRLDSDTRSSHHLPSVATESHIHEATEIESISATTFEGRWGFPKSGGQSLSYWLQQVRCDPLLDHRTTKDLPKSADTIIIGSGITGTLVAKHHIQTWPDHTVVVLEARDFCSGATGRNAGHCKPDQWRGFTEYEKKFGTRQALKILENEQDTWQALVDYVHQNKVDCDLWIGDTYDVPMSSKMATLAHENFTRFKVAGGRTDHIKVTLDPREASRRTRLKGAQACYAWPASTLQPRKLVGHIMRENLARGGVNLQTFTTARTVKPSTQPGFRWTVCTDRGSIECRNVVHASNAYLPAYEASMRNVIKPKPHMCDKVIPPLAFAGGSALENSYCVLMDDGSSFTINPRSGSDGVVLFGGSNPGQIKLDTWIDEHPKNCVDDSLSRVGMVTREVERLAEDEFDGWLESMEENRLGPGQGYDYSWSGIIALSADDVPFVGELPDKEGQWVCAGHCGHGMARTFTAAPGLVRLLNGESWDQTGLPEVYQLTRERLARIKTY